MSEKKQRKPAAYAVMRGEDVVQSFRRGRFMRALYVRKQAAEKEAQWLNSAVDDGFERVTVVALYPECQCA